MQTNTGASSPRVLIINPDSPFLYESRVFAPTGILYAASELEAKGVQVTLLDLARPTRASDQDRSYAEIAAEHHQWCIDQIHAAAPDFDVIGVSATTPQYKFAVQILEAIREANPNAKTVIGGAHATLVSGLRQRATFHQLALDPTLKDNPVELEARLHDFDPNFRSLALYDHIVSGSATGIHKVLAGTNEKWIASEALSKNIDNVPIPARHLIDLDSYHYTLKNPRTGSIERTTNVMSQWGCPFPCNFCSGRDDDFFRTVRDTTPEATIRELDGIHERYGYKGFMFFDDELNIKNDRFRKLLELLKERHLSRGYVYRGFVKSEIIVNKYPDTFKRMVEAGFAEACTGVESGSERILGVVIRKNTTPGINLRAAELARAAGISFKAFTMIGHPKEDEQDALDTYHWILMARPTGFDITVHQPYPGAPVYDFAVKDPASGLFFLTDREVAIAQTRQFTRGSRIEDAVFFFKKPDYGDPHVDSFYKGKPGEYVSNVWTPYLSRERIVELRDFIEREARRKLGATSVSGISFDSVMGQAAGAVIAK